jgi:hypothetical protein
MTLTLFSEMYELMFYVQGDTGGNVNIIGGDSIVQCENKRFVKTCLILNGYPKLSCFNLAFKSFGFLFVCSCEVG